MTRMNLVGTASLIGTGEKWVWDERDPWKWGDVAIPETRMVLVAHGRTYKKGTSKIEPCIKFGDDSTFNIVDKFAAGEIPFRSEHFLVFQTT